MSGPTPPALRALIRLYPMLGEHGVVLPGQTKDELVKAGGSGLLAALAL